MKSMIVVYAIVWLVLIVSIFAFITEFQKDPCIRWSFNGIKQEFCIGLKK